MAKSLHNQRAGAHRRLAVLGLLFRDVHGSTRREHERLANPQLYNVAKVTVDGAALRLIQILFWNNWTLDSTTLVEMRMRRTFIETVIATRQVAVQSPHQMGLGKPVHNGDGAQV